MKPFTEKELQVIKSFKKNPNQTIAHLASNHDISLAKGSYLITRYLASIRTKKRFAFKEDQ